MMPGAVAAAPEALARPLAAEQQSSRPMPVAEIAHLGDGVTRLLPSSQAGKLLTLPEKQVRTADAWGRRITLVHLGGLGTEACSALLCAAIGPPACVWHVTRCKRGCGSGGRVLLFRHSDAGAQGKQRWIGFHQAMSQVFFREIVFLGWDSKRQDCQLYTRCISFPSR